MIKVKLIFSVMTMSMSVQKYNWQENQNYQKMFFLTCFHQIFSKMIIHFTYYQSDLIRKNCKIHQQIIINHFYYISMTKRAVGIRDAFQQVELSKQQPSKFEWIDQIQSEFREAVQKPIEIRQTLMKNSQLQRCLLHNIIFSIYCTICRKVLCASCMYTNLIHRKHRVIPIESAVEEIKEDVKTFDSKIPHIIQLSDGLIKVNSDFLVDIQKEYKPIVMKIQQFYESLRQLIKVKEKQQLKLLKDKRQTIRNQISAYNKELSRISQYVQEKYKSYSNIHIKPQLLIPSRNILQNLLAATNYVNDSTLDLQKFKFAVKIQKIMETKANIGLMIGSLVPFFEQYPFINKFTSKSKDKLSLTRKSLSPVIDIKKQKKIKTSLEKKQKSSFAEGHRTQRRY